MKKLVSLVCALALVVGMLAMCAVSASAEVDASQTVVDVKSGDEVSYTLYLGDVPTPVIGFDFSMYYDSSLFDVVSVADFSGSTNEEDWQAVINTALDGEVRGNFSAYPRSIDFSTSKVFLIVNLKAKAAGSGHLSYYIRYLYDNAIFANTEKIQITEFKFTCDVKVNGQTVIENAQPELNVDKTQDTGVFVNSVTGDSKDADPEIPKTVAKPDNLSSNWDASHEELIKQVEIELENAQGNDSGDNGGNNAEAKNNANSAQNNANGDSKDGKTTGAAAAPLGTDAQGNYVTATDSQGNITATSDTAPSDKSGGSPVIWIVIGLLLVAGGGAAFFFLRKKNASNVDDIPVTEFKEDNNKF